MAISGRDLIRGMNQYAPPHLAVEKDPIGLQVGKPDAEVNGILVTLDVNEEVVDEAIQQGTNWIVAHHPVIYHPLKALRTDHPTGRMFGKLLKHEINVFVAHTNLDATFDGVNDVLAEKLQLEEIQVLIPSQYEKLKKLVVFVPETHRDSVFEAIGNAGAGWIGNYSHCTFQTSGIGTFVPMKGTNPYLGKQNELEKVNEIRIETVIQEANQKQVIEAMLEAHPYEEVAYDIYPLELKGKEQGFGRIGRLHKAMTLKELAEKVKLAYQISGLHSVGDLNQSVQTVAILGGSGGSFIKNAAQMGADVYITGDIGYHTAQDADALGLAILDPGHHVEHLVVERVCEQLKKRLQASIPILASQIDTNPFRFV
ncbi:Nif3-like dinuclear metal center hexameric protein [Hazenella coriacea]|uniref:GTP cyclohydrolase 1 type 2 homolog n=1 Tax=Hazenella coriacea TaxID=1179467 RepID=A0A4R3L6N4_9BACL|nr:Nif3-like dinuclear metal center hexameric protein [Hazenella coriacea]TCS94738.1 dinuclear metal center YbgI/SA1388 family protein [Hazenella coriacea]